MPEKFQEFRISAKRKINLADHMLTQTYPLVQDPKLLITVLENVFLALTNSMSSILYYERLFKKIPPFQDTFDSKFNMFDTRIAQRYKIPEKYLSFMREMKDIIMQHRKSPIEFSRKDKLVICNEEYKMRTISPSNIKEYINTAKEFILIADKITSKDEQIFKK